MNFQFPSNFFFNSYISLINKAKTRDFSGYVENHHIYPKAIFGEENNIETVKLSYKYHIISHYLLWRGYQVAFGDKDVRTEKAKRAVYSMKVRVGHHRQKLEFLVLAKKACKDGNFKHSEETKRKISNTMKGRTPANLHSLHSPQAIAKGALSRSGLNSPIRRPVRNIDTGEIFPLMSWAAKKHSISQTGILAACRGTQKTSAGYRWEFYKEEDTRLNI